MSLPLTDNISLAVGNAEESRRLHMVRQLSPEATGEEAFHRDARAIAGFRRKCAAFACILGACTAAALVAARRASSASVSAAATAKAASAAALVAAAGASGGAASHFMKSALSFLRRFPLIVPAALGVGYVVFRMCWFEREFRARERAREEWELANFRDGEVDEMVTIYRGRGLSEDHARRMVDIMSSDDQLFIECMLVDELGFSPVPPPGNREAFDAALAAAGAFAAAASVPLLAVHVVDGCCGAGGGAATVSKLARWAPELVLSAVAATIGYLESRMMLRAYLDNRDSVSSALSTLAWVAATYGVTWLTVK